MQLLNEQSEMSHRSGNGSRGDPERRFLKDVEDLLEVDPPDAMFFEQRLNALRLEAYVTVDVEE